MVVIVENDWKNKDIESDINERNFYAYEVNCKVIHSYVSKYNNMKTVIIETPSILYARIKNNKGYVYIGCQRYKSYGDLNMKPCTKCGKYGHGYKKCKTLLHV